MNFVVAYPATLAAERERLIVFRCVIEKRVAKKKYIITKDGISRIPTIPPTKASDDWYNRPKPE